MKELKELLAREDQLEQTTNVLKAIAHPLRLKILCVLNDQQEYSVSEIIFKVGSSQSNISQHLDILRSKNIITSRRVGNRILCCVKNGHILAMIATIKNLFCETN